MDTELSVNEAILVVHNGCPDAYAKTYAGAAMEAASSHGTHGLKVQIQYMLANMKHAVPSSQVAEALSQVREACRWLQHNYSHQYEMGSGEQGDAAVGLGTSGMACIKSHIAIIPDTFEEPGTVKEGITEEYVRALIEADLTGVNYIRVMPTPWYEEHCCLPAEEPENVEAHTE